MAERGGFGPPIESNSTNAFLHSGTEKGTIPPELVEVVDGWQALPEHIRLSILALVRSVKGGA